MSTQIVQPDLGIKGAAGYCLSVAEDVGHTPHAYDYALEAWNSSSSSNHPNEQPPSDVCVVVYWSYYDKNDNVWYGHVAWNIPGSGVYTSPFNISYGSEWYPSIQAMTDRINKISEAQSVYLGWSESLAGVKLVDITQSVPAASNQRQVINSSGVNGRSAPNTDASVIKGYEKGDILDFKGYVVGQDPYGNGNTIWFVGAYSDTYWYSGAFSDSSTNGLTNLTPAIPTEPATPTPSDPVPAQPSPVDDLSYHVVVNKKYPNTPVDYSPPDLTAFGNGQLMRKDAADMVRAMQNDSGADVVLIPQSGYRSYSDQQTVYDGYDPSTRDTFSARPGYSEHQTGLAMDFSPIDDSFKDTAQYTWLVANAYKYGFVLRYPDGSEAITGYEFEPWHWRYLGTDAIDFYNKGERTLEQYYNVTGGDYEVVTTPTDPTPDPTPVVPEPWWKPVLRALLAIIGIKI